MGLARSLWPREMVGGLAGVSHDSSGRVAVIEHFVPLPNRAIAGDRFAVAPAAFAACVAAIEAKGLSFLGFAHSHPGGRPMPSSIDEKELWRGCLQLIVSVAGGVTGEEQPANAPCDMRCFWLEDACGPEFREVPIVPARDPATIERDGFAIHKDVFPEPEIERILAELAAHPLEHSRAGARHVLHHPTVTAIANDPRLLAIAKHTLGATAVPFRATLFAKTPLQNWLVVWHQDTALPFTKRREAPGFGPWSIKANVHYAHAPTAALERVLALRLHLDATTGDNGALRVLPGSHHHGVLDDPAVAEYAHGTEPFTCEVGRGGILAMRPLIIHSSSKSQSPAPRRVLHLEYADSLQSVAGFELRPA